MSDSTTETNGTQRSGESVSSTATRNLTVTEAIRTRHSTRQFQEGREVPMNVMEECLELAQQTPSSTNLQPWRLWMVTGNKLASLKKALHTEASEDKTGKQSTVPPTPAKYKPWRSELGHILYGPDGYNIERSDKEGHRRSMLRNYRFFDAPLVLIVGVDEDLNKGADWMSVGMYLQTLGLLLTDRALGTCWQVSTSGYPHVLKKELAIPDNVFILCSMCVGYEDESQSLNSIIMPRNSWQDHVTIVSE